VPRDGRQRLLAVKRFGKDARPFGQQRHRPLRRTRWWIGSLPGGKLLPQRVILTPQPLKLSIIVSGQSHHPLAIHSDLAERQPASGHLKSRSQRLARSCQPPGRCPSASTQPWNDHTPLTLVVALS
jgi:hypothetical protein